MVYSGMDVSAFAAVPAWVARHLRTHLDLAVDEVLGEVRRGDPPLAADQADRVRAGLAVAIRHFCDLIEDPDADWERVAAFYLGFGGHLARDGRDLVDAQHALRRSALAVWRTLAEVPGGLDLDRRALGLVVDAQFAYMDAVSRVIAAGYAAEDRRRATDLTVRRRRARLLHLLLADPPADPGRVAALAGEARWPLPAQVAAVAVRRRERPHGTPGAEPGAPSPRTPASNTPPPDTPSPGTPSPGTPSSRTPSSGPASSGTASPRTAPSGTLPPDAPSPGTPPSGTPSGMLALGALAPEPLLADLAAPEPCLLVPDPESPGRAALPEALLPGWVVAIGPTVPVARAADSLRWARETLALAERGVLPDTGLIRSAEHVPTLVVCRAAELIDEAAATRLAPLSTVPPGRRERLAETLLVLLEHNFNAADASRRLRVHPQTVRYRLRHLRDLFGDDLRDPRRCLEMELILHARLVNRRAVRASPS